MSGRGHGSVSNDAEALRIWLLGRFSVSLGSRPIEKGAWRLRKAASLVKLLALATRHRLHREQAMDLLWPDSATRAASNNLRQVLYGARRVLDPASDSHKSYLSLQDEHLVLSPDGQLWVDVDAFEEAAAVFFLTLSVGCKGYAPESRRALSRPAEGTAAQRRGIFSWASD